MYTLNGWWFLSSGGSYPPVFTVGGIHCHDCVIVMVDGMVVVIHCWLIVIYSNMKTDQRCTDDYRNYSYSTIVLL